MLVLVHLDKISEIILQMKAMQRKIYWFVGIKNVQGVVASNEIELKWKVLCLKSDSV